MGSCWIGADFTDEGGSEVVIPLERVEGKIGVDVESETTIVGKMEGVDRGRKTGLPVDGIS